MYTKLATGLAVGCLLTFSACQQDSGICTSDRTVNRSRGACDETLTFTPSYMEAVTGNQRSISSNSIPITR